jgi:hypothetical protein
VCARPTVIRTRCGCLSASFSDSLMNVLQAHDPAHSFTLCTPNPLCLPAFAVCHPWCGGSSLCHFRVALPQLSIVKLMSQQGHLLWPGLWLLPSIYFLQMSHLFLALFWFSEISSHSVIQVGLELFLAQADFELNVLLPQFLKYWVYRHVTPHLTLFPLKKM